MTSKRLYFVLLACLALLSIGLVAGAYGVNSLLSSRATKSTNLKAQSMALDQQQISLKKAQADVRKYSGLEQITKTVVPEDKNQAESVRQIVNIAADNNISLSNITFPASTLGNLPIRSGAAATTTPTAPVVVNPKTAALSQLLPVKNIPGVYNLLITVQSNTKQPVPYSKFVNFLSDLEHNRRTAQVSTIAIAPDKDDSSLLSFTLSLNEYIQP